MVSPALAAAHATFMFEHFVISGLVDPTSGVACRIHDPDCRDGTTHRFAVSDAPVGPPPPPPTMLGPKKIAPIPMTMAIPIPERGRMMFGFTDQTGCTQCRSSRFPPSKRHEPLRGS